MSSLPDFLLLEEDPFMARKLASLSQNMGFFCVVASNTRQGRMHLDIHGAKLRMVAISLTASDSTRIQLFHELRKKHPQLPVLLLVIPDMLPQAANAKAKGKAEYLVKPFEMDVFQGMVNRLMNTSDDAASATPTEWATNDTTEPSRDIPVLIGSSPGIVEVFEKLGKVTRLRTPVILTGQKGTGKSLVAEILHNNGPTKTGGRVQVDCAEAPRELYTKLFGCQDGDRITPGVISQAPGGTLILENIEKAPPEVQSGLLQLLEVGSYRQNNSLVMQKASPRLIFTTTQDLAEYTTRGLFRQDLYFRITEAPIYMPSLAERKMDIPALARRFLRRHENPEILGFSEECWPRLQAYQWPGNLVELDQVVQQAMEKCPRGYVQPQHLPALLETGESLLLQGLRVTMEASLGAWLEERVKCRPATYDAILQELECGVLNHLLGKYDQKPTFLAEALDINRNTLRKKLEMNGLGKRQHRKSKAERDPVELEDRPQPTKDLSLAG